MGANFGIAGLDWQQRVNWDRMRKYRLERARERMKAHGLGAMLCMYDENVRYLTGTLTPGWNRLKPGLRYAMLCGDDPPVLFEQGDLGFQIERHSPWIPKENVRWSYAWIKGAAGPASTQQVGKFTKAALEQMKKSGVEGMKLGVVFFLVNIALDVVVLMLLLKAGSRFLMSLTLWLAYLMLLLIPLIVGRSLERTPA